MVAFIAQSADAGVAVAVIGNVNLQLRRLPLDVRGVDAQAGMSRVRSQSPVQDGGMGGIDAAFQRLQPVAFLNVLGDMTVGVRHGRPLEFGRRRRMLRRPQIRPDDAAQLQSRISRSRHFGWKIAVRRLVHHIHALAVHIELPAVIDAAQAAFLVATQPKRRQPMRAKFLQ